MANRKSVMRSLAFGGALLAVASCGGGDDSGGSTGTLVVPFELGNRRSCDQLMVKRVRADLDDGEVYSETVPCSNGEVRIRDVRSGTYTVTLYGENSDDDAILDSSQVGVVSISVAGSDNTTVVKPPVTLTSAPARLWIRWSLGFGSCKNTGFESFYVKVWRKAGDELLLSDTLDCNEEGDGPDQYRQVKDPGRALGGGDVGEVTVTPLDKNGTMIGEPVVFKFDSPGAGKDIKLSISCNDGACRSSGKPDPDDD